MSVPNDWYIIGCGPSMSSFNWAVLKGLTTVAVNGAIINTPEPAYFLTACSAFSRQAFRNNFWRTKARKILIMGEDHKNYNRVKPFVKAFDEVHVPYRFDGQIGFTWSKFATGKNSGFCGMQFAVLQGAKVIHLVGFDLGTAGHHYGVGGPKQHTLDIFYQHFVTGIRILQAHNIKVVSHTATSRLNGVIPYEAL